MRSLFGNARDRAEHGARDLVHDWVGAEQRFGAKVGSLMPRDEPLSPGIYTQVSYTPVLRRDADVLGIFSVGVVTLLGSIISRHRGFVLRSFTPLTFFLASSAIVLPATTASIASYLDSLHQHYSPQTAAISHDLYRSTSQVWSEVAEAEVGARRKLEGILAAGVAKVRKASEGNVDGSQADRKA